MSRAVFERAPDRPEAYPTRLDRLLSPRLRHYRPVVIVSRYDSDPPRALILYVPLTTQNRQSPYEVVLPSVAFLDRHSVANVQGVGSLPKLRLERRLGRLPDEVMTKVKRALAFALDFGIDT